jgi:hypothetical protein
MGEGLSAAEVGKEIAEHRAETRYGLVIVGIVVLILAVGTLTTLPGPPT